MILQPLFTYLFKLEFKDHELSQDECEKLTECVINCDIDYIDQTIVFTLRETELLNILKIITKNSFDKIIFKYMPTLNKILYSIEFGDITVNSIKSYHSYAGKSDILKYTFKCSYRTIYK